MPSNLDDMSLDELLAMKRRMGGGVNFKNPSVEREFEGVDPRLQAIAMTSPQPLTVTSGARSPETNRAVGGVPDSYHTKGQALDIRKTGDLSDAIENFKAQGYNVLNEPDHFHVEPMKNPSPPDPKLKPIDDYSLEELREMKRKAAGIPATPPRITATPLKDTSGNPIWSGYRHFLRSSTTGLSEPVAAGLSALTEKGINAFNTVPEMAGEEPMLPERSLGEAYDYYRNKQREDLARMSEQNPISSGIGEIAGVMAPGGVYSQLSKGVKAAVPAFAEGASIAKNLLKAIPRGGFTALGYEQLNPDAERTPEAMGRQFASGGLGEAIGPALQGIGKGLKSGGSKVINKLLKSRDLEEELAKGKNLGQEMISKKDIGTINSLEKKSKVGLQENEDKLQKMLKEHPNANEPIDKGIVKEELESLKNNFMEVHEDGGSEVISGYEKQVRGIDRKLKELDSKKEIPAKIANETKRKIYAEESKAYLKKDPSFNDELQMAYAKGLKRAIEDKIPDVSGINQELSYYGRLNKAMRRSKMKSETQGLSSPISWRDLALGGATGYGTGNPFLGGLVTVGGSALNTMPGATAAGVGMDWLGRALERIGQLPFGAIGPSYENINMMFNQ